MRPADAGPLFALVGVGGDELIGVGPDLTAPARSRLRRGRARAVREEHAARGDGRVAARQGATIVVGAPKPSPLRALAGRPGVLAVVEDAVRAGRALAGAADRASPTGRSSSCSTTATCCATARRRRSSATS